MWWHYFFIGCKYIDRSQWDYFTKGLWVLFNPFSFFHMKEFLDEIFCNLLLKIHIVAPIFHMFCVNHCWINMKISKRVIFFHILHFILKNYHNFESYQSMLTTLGCFFNIIIYNFIFYVMHITPHLHMVKDSWKFRILKNI